MPAPKDPIKREEWLKNQRRTHKGKKLPPRTPEHKKHLSEAGMGKTPWNKGMKMPESFGQKIREIRTGTTTKTETRLKQSISMMGNTHTLGFHPTKETREKMRASAHKGPEHHNWKDGITKIEKSIRRLPEYSEWVNSVFKRDNYICQDCKQRGGDLNAHHIDEFSEIIKRNNIKTIPEALQCQELWNVDNGITLCVKCHKKKTRKIKF